MSSNRITGGFLRDLLLHLLLGDAPAAIRELGAADWMKVVVLAEAWNTLPRLNQRLAALGIVPPEPARGKLRSVSTAAFARSAQWARHGAAVLEALQADGICAAAFKGFAAMAAMHGVQHRVIGDVDVLVAESDLRRATACLARLGFHLDLPGSLEEYVDFIRHSPSSAGNLSVPVCDPRCGEIDLHWALGLHGAGFQVEPLIARARLVKLFGRPVRVAAPADGLILTAHHALRENFAPGTTVKDLIDVEGWCALLESTGEVGDALSRARAADALNALLAATAILVRLNPASPALAVHARLRAAIRPTDAADIERLADLFEIQIREGAIERDVLYLLQPRSLRKIAGGLMGGWRRHLQWVEFMEAKNAGHISSTRERVRGMLSGLRRMSPRRVRMLRTLARTKDRVSS